MEAKVGYKVVVAGATGNVGREMLNILAEREFPVDQIVALASRNSLGTEISFGDKTLKTKDLDTFDFTGWDIALFAVGSEANRAMSQPVKSKVSRSLVFRVLSPKLISVPKDLREARATI